MVLPVLFPSRFPALAISLVPTGILCSIRSLWRWLHGQAVAFQKRPDRLLDPAAFANRHNGRGVLLMELLNKLLVLLSFHQLRQLTQPAIRMCDLYELQMTFAHSTKAVLSMIHPIFALDERESYSLFITSAVKRV
jgi:hypothetical protein